MDMTDLAALEAGVQKNTKVWNGKLGLVSFPDHYGMKLRLDCNVI